MAEIDQLCTIELDTETIYRITDIRQKRVNIVTKEAQTISSTFFVDVEEVENPEVKKINIPIYNIHLIESD